MPSGAGIIVYRGARDTVYRIKYVDGGGRQVMETLGGEREGWTRKKAEAELRERLVRRRLVEAFGPMPLGAIRPRHVAEYVAGVSSSYSAATVNRDVDLLHAI